MAFGVPPIIKFGSRALQDRFLPDLLLGRKRICIAITEPDAGSDVAGITTTARRTPDGRFYVVEGMKKWITNGIFSDYACMAVRTGGEGAVCFSFLEKSPCPDFSRQPVPYALSESHLWKPVGSSAKLC